MKTINCFMSAYCVLSRLPVAIILMLMLQQSCTDERSFSKIDDPIEGDREVVLGVSLPAVSLLPSRAITGMEENTIVHMDLLSFSVDPDPPYREMFAYHVVCRQLSEGEHGSVSQQFIAKVKALGGKQRFVLVANAAAEVSTLVEAVPWDGTAEKKAMLEKLIFKNKSSDHKWNASSQSSFTPFPMWGESEAVMVGAGVTQVDNIKMLRALARIDVTLAVTNDAASAQKNFKLSSVHLYNTKTAGRIVPNTTATAWDDTAKSVLQPTLPNEPENYTGPLAYTVMTDPDKAIIQEIYTPEAAGVAGSHEATKATCIVVGGFYQADTKPSYYRLDFLKAENRYNDILRNHCYLVSITKAKARGYNTVEEAFNAKPVNMDADIVEWDAGDMSNVTFDGQYFLGANQAAFTLSKEAHEAHDVPDEDNVLLVSTDYPNGWTIDPVATTEPGGVNTVSWLSVNNYSGVNANGKSDTVKIITPLNTSGSIRTAYLTIRAARLVFYVKVTQTMISQSGVTIVDKDGKPVSELIFSSLEGERPGAQTITVKWAPSDNQALVTCSPYNGKPLFLFDTNGYDVISGGTLAGGERTFTICPVAFTESELASDPIFERSAVYSFIVTDDQSTHSAVLVLRQLQRRITSVVAPYYILNGSEQFLTVRSSLPWKASIADNNGGGTKVIERFVTTNGSGKSDALGERLSFLAVRGNFSGTATVHIDPVMAGTFAPFDVRLHFLSEIPWGANCHLTVPNGSPVEIPVNYLYQAMGQLPAALADPGLLGREWLQDSGFAKGRYKVQVLWSDVGTFGQSGVVRDVSLSGTTFFNAKLTVTPGSSSGNAVVILYEENGKRSGYQRSDGDLIKWSWHIWSTAERDVILAGVPEFPTVMPCNLGATGYASSVLLPVDRLASGLKYQWGRKDPFPGTTNSLSYQIPYYYPVGIEAADRYRLDATGTTGLASAVNHPLNTLDATDWYGAIPYNYLWGLVDNSSVSPPFFVDAVTERSIYDPCPAGWKVPSFDSRAWSPWIAEDQKVYLAGSYLPYTEDFRTTSSYPDDGSEVRLWYWQTAAGSNHLGFNFVLEFTAGSDDVRGGNGSNQLRGKPISVRCVRNQPGHMP